MNVDSWKVDFVALNVDSLKVILVVIYNTCSKKEESNSETASSKRVKECSLNSKTKDVHAIKYKMSKGKERCMAYFRSLHSRLQVLSKGDSKGTRIEHGFKWEFMSLFGQDVDTFTRTMLLNVDQLQKQLDKDEFQEDGSMTAFWVVNNQFQKFIDSKFTLDYDSQMTDTYFVEYTGIEVQHFKDTLLQHLGNVKKSVAERTRHQRQTDSTVQDDNIRSGNDTDADDADIRPIYDEEPIAKVGLTTQIRKRCLLRKDTRKRWKLKTTSVPTSARIQTTTDDRKPNPRSNNHHPRSLLFSPNKTSAVSEKTSPRSDLRWKPTGRIFKSVGLRWIPTGKLFDSCTSKVDSEPPHGSNVDIPHIHECKQTLDVSAGTSINVQKEQSLDLSADDDTEQMTFEHSSSSLGRQCQMASDHVSSDPGPQCSTTVLEQDSLSPGPQSQENVPQVAETVTTSNELELLYSPMFSELLNGNSPVVSKSSAVHAADNPLLKHQTNIYTHS
ncbi:hypothetical protein Tco_0550717 [Tanacetum coccineum]